MSNLVLIQACLRFTCCVTKSAGKYWTLIVHWDFNICWLYVLSFCRMISKLVLIKALLCFAGLFTQVTIKLVYLCVLTDNIFQLFFCDQIIFFVIQTICFWNFLLPLNPVCPKDKILLFFTIIQPTDGFSPVKPTLSLAKFIAIAMKYLSKLFDLSFFEDINFIYKLNKIFFFSKISIDWCKSNIGHWIQIF